MDVLSMWKQWRLASYLHLEYSYSKYWNLIGQMQGNIFCSALVQDTILIVPAGYEGTAQQHTFCAIQLKIIHVLCNYVVTRSFLNHPLFVYQSESESAC